MLEAHIARELKASRAVFAGKVIALDRFIVTMRIDTVWKGDVGAVIEFSTGATRISDGTFTASSCDYRFEEGAQYLVFASGTSDRTMKAENCGFTARRPSGSDTVRILNEIAPSKRPSR